MDMGPVFLFNMGVVILLVGMSWGELDPFTVTVGFQVVVDEL